MISIIAINGPPRSGKDTVADYIISHQPRFVPLKFADPSKDAFCAIFNHSREWVEENKDAATLIDGYSVRQWLIAFSEKFMKREMGDDIFGRLASQRIINDIGLTPTHNSHYIFSDCGFPDELTYLFNYLHQFYPSEKLNLLLLSLYRDGCPWDSRQRIWGEIGAQLPSLSFFDYRALQNDEDLNYLYRQIAGPLQNFMNLP